jgi:hypothetical protein
MIWKALTKVAHSHSRRSPWAVLAAMVALSCGGAQPQAQVAGGGCLKDTDCKGDRVCSHNECVSTGAEASSSTSSTSASSSSTPSDSSSLSQSSAAPIKSTRGTIQDYRDRISALGGYQPETGKSASGTTYYTWNMLQGPEGCNVTLHEEQSGGAVSDAMAMCKMTPKGSSNSQYAVILLSLLGAATGVGDVNTLKAAFQEGLGKPKSQTNGVTWMLKSLGQGDNALVVLMVGKAPANN